MVGTPKLGLLLFVVLRFVLVVCGFAPTLQQGYQGHHDRHQDGRAEAGFGIRAEAITRGLGFVPLLRERFDLVMARRDFFDPPLQSLLAFARGAAFAARAGRMGGYDIAETGRVAFNG